MNVSGMNIEEVTDLDHQVAMFRNTSIEYNG